MHEYNKRKESEISETESRLQQLKQDYEPYRTLLAKDVVFINQPADMPDWGMRVVHLRNPEENLIELFTPLKTE